MNARQPDFWTFSLEIYADPRVQKECLALQDDVGVDVNLLLFCTYMGASYGAILSDAALRQAADHVVVWYNDIVKALRGARRVLKPYATGPSPILDAATALREKLKVIELEAERIEHTLLETWGLERLGTFQYAEPSAAVSANIGALLTMHGEPGRVPVLRNHLIAAALAAARADTRT